MWVFIDANIYLSFYHLTSEDLQELEKLAVLVKNKELNLYIPEQVIDETRRNRDSKINDKFEPLRKEKFSIIFPAYCKNYNEYNLMRDLIKQCEIIHATMVEKIKIDIDTHQLAADKLIDQLFEIGTVIKRTPEIISKAQIRTDIGNPPGKKGSLGDAINWESLLSKATKSKYISVAFISDDGDFATPFDSDKMSDFLISEWIDKKENTPKFYRKLSKFFKEHFPNINLKTESEKDILIEKLASSTNFAATHSIISALSKYDSFTQKQFEDLVRIAVMNSQVGWIISDDDVYNFYKKIDDDPFILIYGYEEFSNLMKSAKTLNDDAGI